MLVEYRPIVIKTPIGRTLNTKAPEFRLTYREARDEVAWRIDSNRRMNERMLTKLEFLPQGYGGSDEEARRLIESDSNYRMIKRQVDETRAQTPSERKKIIRSMTIEEIFRREDEAEEEREVFQERRNRLNTVVFQTPMKNAA